MTPWLEWKQLPGGRILYWGADEGGEPMSFRIGADLIDDEEGKRLLAETGAPTSTTHSRYFRS